MKKLFYIFLAILFILTVLLLCYDVELNIIGVVIFYIMYYLISIFCVFKAFRKKHKNLYIVILILLYITNLFSTSYLMGIPLLLIAILTVSNKKTPLILKIISIANTILLFVLFVLFSFISATIVTKEQGRISNGNISIVTLLVDTGATGSDYKYECEYKLINGFLVVRRVLCTSNDELPVSWVDNSSCMIGNQKYNVRLFHVG